MNSGTRKTSFFFLDYTKHFFTAARVSLIPKYNSRKMINEYIHRTMEFNWLNKITQKSKLCESIQLFLEFFF